MLSIDSNSLKEIMATIGASISVAVAIVSIAGAFKAGVLRKVKIGSIEFEASDDDSKQLKEALAKNATPESKDRPFEIEQLANYYSQILSQSKISFWFSLIFASLGFATIVVSAFLYSNLNGTATAVQFIAGIIMDAVAGLFFVQSRNAQKSMGEFFDKLRSDRLHAESKLISQEISSTEAQDALKLHLSLHYAGVPNSDSVAKHITEQCLKTGLQNV